MIIESLKYTRFEGEASEWTIQDKNGDESIFQNINLLVGKNAVGKSRTLSVLEDISSILCKGSIPKSLKYPSFRYNLTLKEGSVRYQYFLEIKNSSIIGESLFIDGVEKFNRTNKTIFSEKDKTTLTLNISDKEFITSLHNNKESFPYIDEIYEWCNALKYYTFTNQFQKNSLIQNDLDYNNLSTSDRENLSNIITLFSIGKHQFGNEFVDNIIRDMKQIGYEISDVNLLKHISGTGISVQEDELQNPTLQTDMSQGMFRALSFIIQLNYALKSNISICLLIDDLGEGLDFSRSKTLIDIIIYKLNNSNIQLFITTNDRYIMNKVPLKYWTIIERLPKLSVLYNYSNTKEYFDDFKYTGLNNFDFLATNFYLNGFDNQVED